MKAGLHTAQEKVENTVTLFKMLSLRLLYSNKIKIIWKKNKFYNLYFIFCSFSNSNFYKKNSNANIYYADNIFKNAIFIIYLFINTQ